MREKSSDKFFKYLTILALILNIVFFSVLSSIIIDLSYDYDYNGGMSLATLIVGTGGGPHDLDPTDSWDRDSNDIIEQVVETLFAYNLSDPDLPIINLLAESHTWINSTALGITLRDNVRFHDGTSFNADDVKWNLERFMYLMNHTGEISPDGRAVKVHSMYEFPDGSPILNKIVVINSTTLEIHLTAPYAPIVDALCYISAGILSPSATPATSIIDLATGDIVGTGPYTYDYYTTDTRVRFTKFEDYWGSDIIQDEIMFDRMIYSVIHDPPDLNYAMLAGDLDYLREPYPDLFEAFYSNPYITFHEHHEPSTEYHYIKMDIERINVTWRKAVSYALNYTSILRQAEESLGYSVVQASSPMSSSFFGHDPTVNPPIYNLTYAREIVVSMGFGDMSWNESQWETAIFRSWNYTYSTSEFGLIGEQLGPLLRENLKKIGINLTLIDTGGCFIPYWPCYLIWLNAYLSGHLYYLNFFSDILDPFYMFANLFPSDEINDLWLEQKLSDSLLEINNTRRALVYSQIQHYLAEELFPHIFCVHTIAYPYVHAADLYNVLYNPLGKFYSQAIKRNLTWIPTF